MAAVTRFDCPNNQSLLLKMYDDPCEDTGDPRSAAGNIRLLERETTVGELTFTRSRDEMKIEEIFVKPPFRRQGFGTRLLQMAEDLAARSGLKRISLTPSPIDTMTVDNLKAWYHRRGYAPSGSRTMGKPTAAEPLLINS
jgi:GNAT superfamily N-acetyltransferase